VANNYLQFSEELKLTPKQAVWVREELEKADKIEEPDIGEAGPGFDWAFEGTPDKPTLWLHADEQGDAEKAAYFVQAFLRKFRLKRAFTLSWAETCSRPRLSEFGGGAIFVTAKKIEWLSTYSWLADKVKAHKVKAHK